MRHDMPKRFMEPSGGNKGSFPRNTKKLRVADDEGGSFTPHGMRKVHRYANKWHDGGYVGTDFAVLRRFLMSRKGKPWNDVYSEICAEADSRSFPGHHLREWLEYAVEQNCFVDEECQVRDQHGRQIGGCRGEFYVHPQTGLLEVSKQPRRRHTKPEQKVFELEGSLYHEHDGIWYRVRMKEVPKKDRWSYDTWAMVKDVLVGEELNYGYYEYSMTRKLEEEYGRSPEGKLWYCIWKQSANSKEIARLKKGRAA